MKEKHLLLIAALGVFSNLFAQNPGTLNQNFNQLGWNDTIVANNNGVEISKTMIQPDGKIIVTGEAYFESEAVQAIVARYNSDGSVDETYGGGDGIFRSGNDLDIYTKGNGAAMQNDGKVIIGGDYFYNTERIIRVNTDGSLDTSFGEQGIIDMQRPNAEYLYHIAVQSDNKIIACGEERLLVNGSFIDHVFLWRFTANGELDTTFGTNGKVSYITDDFSFSTITINELIVLPNNKIVVNISFSKFSNCSVMLTRINENGMLDSTFGNGGHVIKSEPTTTDNFRYSTSALQADGSIVSVFTKSDENNLEASISSELYRVTEQGIIDNSFSISIPTNTAFPYPLEVRVSENRIFLFDKNYPLFDENPFNFDKIYCFDLSGNPVTAFGNNGVAIVDGNDIPTTYFAKPVISNSGTIFLAAYSNDITIPEQKNLVVSSVNGLPSNLSLTLFKDDKYLPIYPNPTAGLLTISNPDNVKIDKIDIIDVLGKIIATKTDNSNQVDISNLTKGVYIFKIYAGERVFQQKIIKQ